MISKCLLLGLLAGSAPSAGPNSSIDMGHLPTGVTAFFYSLGIGSDRQCGRRLLLVLDLLPPSKTEMTRAGHRRNTDRKAMEQILLKFAIRLSIITAKQALQNS